jgi:hypothetical protein
MKENPWARLLAYVTGLINQELLFKNEYLAGREPDFEGTPAGPPVAIRSGRSMLAEMGKRLGRKALAQVACVAKPDTILAWYRKLIAKKFDGSKQRRYPGRPAIEAKLEELIVKMAREREREALGLAHEPQLFRSASFGRRSTARSSLSRYTLALSVTDPNRPRKPKLAAHTTLQKNPSLRARLLVFSLDMPLSRMSPAPGWVIEVLQRCCMNFLTTRGQRFFRR